MMLPPPTHVIITNDSDIFTRKTRMTMQLAAVVMETAVRSTDPPPLSVLVLALAMTLVRAPANRPKAGGVVRGTNETGGTTHM